MTKSHYKKTLIRNRMEEQGEPYSVSARALGVPAWWRELSAVENFDTGYHMIVAPTAFNKTVTGLNIAERLTAEGRSVKYLHSGTESGLGFIYAQHCMKDSSLRSVEIERFFPDGNADLHQYFLGEAKKLSDAASISGSARPVMVIDDIYRFINKSNLKSVFEEIDKLGVTVIALVVMKSEFLRDHPESFETFRSLTDGIASLKAYAESYTALARNDFEHAINIRITKQSGSREKVVVKLPISDEDHPHEDMTLEEIERWTLPRGSWTNDWDNK